MHTPEEAGSGLNTTGAGVVALVVTAALAAVPAVRRAGVHTPQDTGALLTSATATLADQWAAHEIPSGSFIDPVTGKPASGYGAAMLGQAIVEDGLARGSEWLIEAGLKAELSEISHPNGGGFELLALG